MRLLRDIHQICRIPLDMGGGVRACSLCDPYAVVLLVDGSVVLVRLVERERGREGEVERERGREGEVERERGREGEGGEGEGTGILQLSWPDIKVHVEWENFAAIIIFYIGDFLIGRAVCHVHGLHVRTYTCTCTCNLQIAKFRAKFFR